jgi:N-acetylneuraminate synthase/N,N'-diacetyllegionaminate synthase
MEQFAAVGARVRALGGLFMASAFDVDSLRAIAPQLDALKVASGDLDFHPLLQAAMRTGKPVILSTGMATLAEIDAAVAAARAALPAGTDLADRLALLHCVSLYPTEPRQANLSAIGTLARRYALTTGYSDHTLGVEVAALSLGLGARIIEKHFTLDKSRTSFRDHALSADAAELARLAALVRHAREILGDGERGEGIADRASAASARRSIVAARELPRGHRLAEADLEFLRPGTGLSPANAGRLVGRTLRRALRRQDPVILDDVE